jgi:hypothetical protein
MSKVLLVPSTGPEPFFFQEYVNGDVPALGVSVKVMDVPSQTVKPPAPLPLPVGVAAVAATHSVVVLGFCEPELSLVPQLLLARTRYQYGVLGLSPVTWYVVTLPTSRLL